MDDPHPEPAAERDTSTMVFLSLFLLVLAFFILLTSMSEVNEKSSLDIIQRVKESFGGDQATNLPNTRQRLEAEADAAARQMSDEIKAIFDRDLPGAKTALSDDRLLRVRFPEYEMFSRGRATVRRIRLPLIRQVAGLIRSAPPGVDHRLEISLPDPGPASDAEGPSRHLAIARLGHLAAAFSAEGAAGAEVSIALRPAEEIAPDASDEVLMQVFTLVEEKNASVSFAPARPSAPARPGGAGDGPVLNLRLDRDSNAAVPAGAGGG